ncbi:hypothetical protein HMPREF0307_02010 [Corynebacterium sp. DNF00584]|nr:hypothetical protein HMPREF0307_02010 [Corynebacterium sp. DNF00584]
MVALLLLLAALSDAFQRATQYCSAFLLSTVDDDLAVPLLHLWVAVNLDPQKVLINMRNLLQRLRCFLDDDLRFLLCFLARYCSVTCGLIMFFTAEFFGKVKQLICLSFSETQRLLSFFACVTADLLGFLLGLFACFAAELFSFLLYTLELGFGGALNLLGTVQQLFRLCLGKTQLLFSILLCITTNLFGVLLGLLACFFEYALGNLASLLFSIFLHTLGFFTGLLRPFEFFCSLLAVFRCSIDISLYGAVLPFHLVLTVRKVALPVLLFDVTVKIQRLIVTFRHI